MIAFRIVVLIERGNEIFEKIVRSFFRGTGGRKAYDDRADATLYFALYLFCRDFICLAAERAVFLGLQLFFGLEHRVRHVVQHLAYRAFRHRERAVKGFSFLKATKHLFVVEVVPIAFR